MDSCWNGKNIRSTVIQQNENRGLDGVIHMMCDKGRRSTMIFHNRVMEGWGEIMEKHDMHLRLSPFPNFPFCCNHFLCRYAGALKLLVDVFHGKENMNAREWCDSCRSELKDKALFH